MAAELVAVFGRVLLNMRLDLTGANEIVHIAQCERMALRSILAGDIAAAVALPLRALRLLICEFTSLRKMENNE